MLGLYGAGGAVGTMTGGVLADRWGRRPTLLTAQFGAAALMLALGFARELLADRCRRTAARLFAEAARPAFPAMMIDVVPDRDRLRAFSLNYWAINLGFAMRRGPAPASPPRSTTCCCSSSTPATTLVTAADQPDLPGRDPAAPAATPAPGRAARGPGLRHGLPRPGLPRLPRRSTCFAVLVIIQHLSTLPIAMSADGLGPATFGWVIARQRRADRRRPALRPRLIGGRDPLRVLALATLIIGVGFGLTAFAGTAWFYALTVLIWTLGEMLQSPSNSALIAELSPAALRGRYQGVNSLSWSAGSALAPVVGGFVQEHLGDAALWLGCFAASARWWRPVNSSPARPGSAGSPGCATADRAHPRRGAPASAGQRRARAPAARRSPNGPGLTKHRRRRASMKLALRRSGCIGCSRWKRAGNDSATAAGDAHPHRRRPH